MSVRHLVLLRFQSTADEATRQRIVTDFAGLQTAIDGILAFECGINQSPENLHRGLDHIFLLTFRDAAARDAYLPHPAHQAFVASMQPWIEEVLVVDWRV